MSALTKEQIRATVREIICHEPGLSCQIIRERTGRQLRIDRRDLRQIDEALTYWFDSSDSDVIMRSGLWFPRKEAV